MKMTATPMPESVSLDPGSTEPAAWDLDATDPGKQFSITIVRGQSDRFVLQAKVNTFWWEPSYELVESRRINQVLWERVPEEEEGEGGEGGKTGKKRWGKLKLTEGLKADFTNGVVRVYEGKGKAVFESAGDVYDLLRPMGHGNIMTTPMKKVLKGENALGFCTWNAVGQDLSSEKVIEAVKSLPFTPGFVLIDDGWQKVTPGKEQDDRRFLYQERAVDLRELVRTIKEDLNIPYVGIWHAMIGYWGGIEEAEVDIPTGEPFPMPKSVRYFTKPQDIMAWYDRFHKGLKEDGIDFVKIDVCAALENSPPEIARAYVNAAITASQKYFSLPTVWCMAHTTYITESPRISHEILRTYDDFYPELYNPTWRIHANAFNTCLIQDFTPDWDMFQSVWETKDPRVDGLVKCFSGGMVYCTDNPGSHDSYLLSCVEKLYKQIHGPALLTVDSLFSDPTRHATPVKLFSKTNTEDCYFLAIVNGLETEIETHVSWKDFGKYVPSASKMHLYEMGLGLEDIGPFDDKVIKVTPLGCRLFRVRIR